MLTGLDHHVAQAILGIDTLWGGDVLNPSGTGRFIADSWFSDEKLPLAYSHPAAARLRETGGVTAKGPDTASVDAYLAAVDVRGSIGAVAAEGKKLGGLRGAYLSGLALCFDVMWDLAMELLDRGAPVPYARCVDAMTARPPEPSRPEEKRRLVADMLAAAGHPSKDRAGLLAAVDAWRSGRTVEGRAIPGLATKVIAELTALSRQNVLPHLPADLRGVPLANVSFLPIENAWFSGSMNYLGRARRPDGSPEYEATYEINASLQISVPEFHQLVSHEVVPGHVTTFAFLQNLWVRRRVGFEATVLTMNTRYAALAEGIANNALLMAYGVTDLSAIPDKDVVIGLLLALLQDDAKNQSSYLTWQEKRPQAEVASVLRNEFLVSPERADKLSGAWGRHPLLGRMYLPAYRFGTEKVAALRKKYPPEKVLPVLYGAAGVVDAVTVDGALAGGAP
ncbi:MAG TPA: hypothetical protein PLB02_02375 [Thermoanaerobaculia bacterium]|nr:hypothetical protein [Thermoanaerobaculia bacterium]HQR66217.1 hypothetical protein [Thermoanaerobaculia bacterium]